VQTLLGNHELMQLDGEFYFVAQRELFRLAEGARGNASGWGPGDQQKAGLEAWKAELKAVSPQYYSVFPVIYTDTGRSSQSPPPPPLSFEGLLSVP